MSPFAFTWSLEFIRKAFLIPSLKGEMEGLRSCCIGVERKTVICAGRHVIWRMMRKFSLYRRQKGKSDVHRFFSYFRLTRLRKGGW